MILIVTNRQDRTADFLILELQKRKVDYLRFNTEDYPQRVQVEWRLENGRLSGGFKFPRRRVDFQEIHSIWYRRPVPPTPHPEIDDPVAIEFAVAESETALLGIWNCLDVFWVSHPESLRKAELKLFQLKMASQIGFKIWPTVLTNDPDTAREFYLTNDQNLVYKTIRRGRLVRDEGVSLIYTNPICEGDAEKFDRVAYAPALLQQYVPKELDIRATVIGKKVFAVGIHSQYNLEARHDWRRANTAQLHHALHILPSNIESLCVDLVQKMNLAFGAIDMILTPQGEHVFLEINPNGQWAWIQQICPEIPLRDTLTDLLITSEFVK